MRSMIVCVWLVTAAVLTAGEGVNFTTVTTWDAALELSRTSGKPLFLDAYTDWCGWCKEMDKQTFSDARVAEVMNASFACVKMEMETGGGIDVAMKYRISGFPTFMVFNLNGIPTYMHSGFQPADAWLVTLSNMKDPAKAILAPGVTNKFDLPWPPWLRTAHLKGKARVSPDLDVVKDWFDSYPNKFDEVAWSVAIRFDIGDKGEKFILDNNSEYKKLYGGEYSRFQSRLVERYFRKAVAAKDESLLSKAVSFVQTSSPEEATYTGIRLEFQYAKATTNWKGAGSALLRMAQLEFAKDYADDINEQGWGLYEKCEDPAALTLAARATGLITSGENADWAHIDTHAALLFKSGQIKPALAAAERAVRIGKEQGADVSETETLLAKIKASK